jgi:hypothetical protein
MDLAVLQGRLAAETIGRDVLKDDAGSLVQLGVARLAMGFAVARTTA